MSSHSPTSLAVEGESASSVTSKWQKPRPENLTGVITGYIMFALLMIKNKSVSVNTNATTRAIILRNLSEGVRSWV